MKIAFYGSSLVSSYWNGAATYYRGIIRDLARRGPTQSASSGTSTRQRRSPNCAAIRIIRCTRRCPNSMPC